jgi:hypothetical protein
MEHHIMIFRKRLAIFPLIFVPRPREIDNSSIREQNAKLVDTFKLALVKVVGAHQ